ncbi:hypothetical protein EZI54_06785 [Marinobacter halodurans]|uniref:Peptidoglycan binding-like domain-containing protein n=1 Tax=Marinobacter halodurans TaxID=2528979 RepID=A0ABY1ZQU0_9GAMM|nr:peptidoglycan-binding protein [Marinobacter halodurans]TBW57356.1 hypothetical protein EZI54_06785 [Marinobacter halodurans]
MSDDDLRRGAPENDFEFEDDGEFSIPETPDEDLLGGEDEDLLAGELGNEDLAGLDFEEEPERDQFQDEDEPGPGNRAEAEPEEEERAGAGWMVWTAAGVVMLALFSGLMWFAFGILGGGSNSEPQRAPIAAAAETNSSDSTQVAKAEQPKVKPLPPVETEQQNARAGKAQSEPSAKMNAPAQQSEQNASSWNDQDSLPTPGQPEPQVQMTRVQERNYGREVAQNQMFPPIDGGALKGLESALNKNGDQIQSLSKSLSRSIDASGDKINRRLSEVTARLSDIAEKLDALNTNGSSDQHAAKDSKKEELTAAQEKAQRERVRLAQIRLKAFGYQPGSIDGVFGAHTSAAAKRFQRQNNLDVTGELDGPTVTALMGSNVPTYRPTHQKTVIARPQKTETVSDSQNSSVDVDEWYVRGVTPERAIIYQRDGSSYLVTSGTEVPGKGQVATLNPGQHSITLVGGEVIRRQ